MTAIVTVAMATAGCGSDSGTNEECGFSGELLPYNVGYSWTYRVTDGVTGAIKPKGQRIDRMETHPDYGEVVVQITQKENGSTESFLRRVGDEIRRYEQQDLNSLGELIRTTVYEPYRLRIDESMGLGDEVSETYIKSVTKPLEPVPVLTTITDVWTVTGEDEPCTALLGTFSCVKYHRVRTQGGTAAKDFYFAPGIGKVIEDGAEQDEEVEACGTTP